MVLWFVGTSVLAVLFVFRDNQFDYRYLAVGALLPDAVDIWARGAWVMHSLLASVIALSITMFATRRNRPRRKKYLAIPIGMFMHLVFDAAFARSRIFWWPFMGVGFHHTPLPTVQRGAFGLVLEACGVVMLAYLWRRFGMGNKAARAEFMRTGHLITDSSGQVKQS